MKAAHFQYSQYLSMAPFYQISQFCLAIRFANDAFKGDM
jgi:hypothetical protein